MAIWTQQDAAQLREYLGTQSGERFLALLRRLARMPNAATFEEEAMNSRETKGVNKAINFIESSRDFEEKISGGVQYYE